MLPGPLHRLTRLQDEPASKWLEGLDRPLVTLKGWAAWAAYFAFLYGVRTAVWTVAAGYLDSPALMTMFGGLAARLPVLVGGAVGAALFIPMRRAVVRIRAGVTAKLAREAADRAAPIDDLAALGAEPDGRIVSVVGWVRGHGYVDHPVGGQRAVGLALPCQDGLPFVMETLHNFDLVDEAGHEALILTGDGRMLGASNVQLSRANPTDRQLLMSLNLPATTVPADWNAFVVRDGDPVLVVGTKTTVQDLTELQHNRSPQRTAIASSKRRPLLVFPLPAERREV